MDRRGPGREHRTQRQGGPDLLHASCLALL
jgi:hypothetical protein